ncbi:MAG: hypothetical protein G01um101425_316 [Candidatus Peregrinibacteria bacterium Gr01-1014_25]|nr:MAG: hypothetical protein G01um101425_316 [Candidatus Peregrinibacteria bacterium Gr01-1014_25]
MTPSSAIVELAKMPVADLARDIAAQRTRVAKIRMDIHAGSEKDTAQLRRERRVLARMLTVLHRHGPAPASEGLKEAAKTATIGRRPAATAKRTTKKKAHSPSAA